MTPDEDPPYPPQRVFLILAAVFCFGILIGGATAFDESVPIWKPMLLVGVFLLFTGLFLSFVIWQRSKAGDMDQHPVHGLIAAFGLSGVLAVGVLVGAAGVLAGFIKSTAWIGLSWFLWAGLSVLVEVFLWLRHRSRSKEVTGS